MGGVLGSLWQDLRFAIRSLNKNRRFTLLAVLALALGIGSATVIFSAVYGVILNTFGYEHPDQIISFAIHDVKQSGVDGRESLEPGEFLDYRDRIHSLQDITGGYGGFGSTPVLYTTGSSTDEFSVWYNTANLFQFMGTPPLLGRWATPDDTKAGATPVFMMTYKLWHGQFNSDPTIINKSFNLDGVQRTLVGVMPPRFRWGWPDIWIPLPMDRSQIATDPKLKDVELWTVGRLKPGVNLKAAIADLNIVAHEEAKIYPKMYPKDFRITARTLADRVLTPFKTLIYPLAWAVSLLLLIACSNVANLLLAQATARDREIAVRASLGASRWRLVRQLLVESFVLATIACVVGCVLAWVGIKEMVPLVPWNAFPQEAVIGLNGEVLLFAIAATLVTTLLSGLAPAFHAMRGDLVPRLSGSGRGAGAGASHGKMRATLVISEVALSIVLLIGAGLMMRSFIGLDTVDLGFSPQHILLTGLQLPKGEYDSVVQKNALFEKLFARLESVPGVISATVTMAPPPNEGIQSQVTIPSRTHSENWTSAMDLCGEGYFKTLGLRLLRGRLFTDSDISSGRYLAVINQTFARKYFGNDNPIGEKVKFNVLDQLPGLKDTYFEVIGVVPDVRNNGLEHPPMPEAFVPHTITGLGNRAIMIRTAADPEATLPALRQQIWSVDHSIALNNPGSMESFLYRDNYSGPEFGFILLTVFATIGLTLVVIGIFSVMAYTVSLQTREIGIRMALGAQRENILAMVLRKGLWLIGGGVAIGLLASWGATRIIASQLVGVTPTDPWTFSVVIVIVAIIGLLACAIPARRATKVDPLTALRYE